LKQNIIHRIIFVVCLLCYSILGYSQSNFASTKPTGCAPLNTVLNANTTSAVKWLWEFGNGNSSTLENPSAQYILPGKFTVKLTTWDAGGTETSHTKTDYITVFKKPIASFTSTKKEACVGDLLSLTSTSTIGDAAITGYSWDFGNGTISKDVKPSHSYAKEGKYNVSVVVTDANSCFHKITTNDFFLIHPRPTANFSQDIVFDCKAPAEVNFRNKSTGNGLSYEWNFGDSSSSSGKDVKNTYKSQGKYNVSLKVTSDKGCVHIKTVKNAVTIEPLKVDFSGSPIKLCEAGTVHFQNLSSTGGSIAYTWEFGDGETSSKSYPSHAYTNSKRHYNVTLKLKVVNRPGCEAELTKPAYVSVYPKPDGSISVDNMYPCYYPFTLNYEYKDSIESSSIDWFVFNKDDSKTLNFSSGKNKAKISIQDSALRSIWVAVKNKYGCSDTITAPVVRKVRLNPAFIGDTTGCASLFTEFIETSTGDFAIKKRDWFIDYSFYSNQKSFQYLFNKRGEFRIGLVVEYSNGCIDSISRVMKIGVHLDPKFIINDTHRVLCNNELSELFINKTKYIADSAIDEFRWYGDRNSDIFSSKKPDESGNYISTNTRWRYKSSPGIVRPMLVSVNNNCYDTFLIEDSFKILAPLAIAIKSGDACFDSLLTVTNESIDYHRWFWVYNKKIDSTSILLKLDINKKQDVKLKVFNDTTGCWDTMEVAHEPTQLDLSLDDVLTGTCTPASVTLTATEDMSRGYWVVNTKDTFLSSRPFVYHFDTAGDYTIEFHYVVGNCDYPTEKTYKIFNGTMSGSVTDLGTCKPFTVNLYDSTYTPGSTNHVWVINNTHIFPVTSKSMDIEMPGSFSDKVLIILRDTSTGNRCVAEQYFNVNNSAPGFTLIQGWSNTCTKSFFQGNMLANPDKGKGPFDYLWTFSNGKTFTTKVVSCNFVDTGWVFVAMKIADQNGCYSRDTFKFYRPPNRIKVDFDANKNGSTCTPMYVDFFDKSTSLGQKIVRWKWEFGDKSISYFRNPRHQYLNPGVYDIRLTVTDDIGCTETKFYPKYLVLRGPDGDFTISDLVGCTPHKTYFKEQANNPLATMLWDYGDGVVDTGNSPTHIYTRPGIYIPSLIIREKPGCEYAVPQKDTIFIYENPKADFTGNGVCVKDLITFNQDDKTVSDLITKRWWIFPDKTFTGNLSSVNHRFTDKKSTEIIHIAETENGCRDTVSRVLKLKEPTLNILGGKETLCLGNAWFASAEAKADTTIRKMEWYINNAFYDTGIVLRFQPPKANLYAITLRVEDEAGCWDTTTFPKRINVGDTVTPPVVPIRFVSVFDDGTHQINFNKLPSTDFSSYTILQDHGGVFSSIRSVANQSDTNQYIYGVDALNRSYCYKLSVKNLCRYENRITTLATHCTVESKAKPLLNAAKINWSPYVGWPVYLYEIQRLNETTLSFDSIGSVPGNIFAFIDSNIICNQEHSYKIKAYHLDTQSHTTSFSDTCKAKPFYYNIVNPPVFTRATVVNGIHVNLEWEEIYSNRNPIIKYAIDRKYLGSGYYHNRSNLGSQAYTYDNHKTEVNNHSYTYRMRSIDACDDTSEYTSIAKSILLKTHVNNDYQPVLNWTSYQKWPEGVQEYVVEKRIAGELFKEIGRTSSFDTTFKDKFSELNCIKAFDYRVYAIRPNDTRTRVIRSYSNYSSPAVEPKIFVPNAFSPNQNRLNETFHPVGIFIKSYTMKIYSRWGEKLYDSDECMNAWDGNYMGDPAVDGVYAYKIVAWGINDELYNLVGNVTLIR